jgi:oxygen-independent coproporphyrinogen-3 oxidase
MQEQEVTTAEQQRLERIMMGLRLAEGLPVVDLEMNDDDIAVLSEGLIDEGLIEPGVLAHGRLALTRRGRLLADAVVRRLVD